MKVGSLIECDGYIGVVVRKQSADRLWQIYWFDGCYTFISETYKDVRIIA